MQRKVKTIGAETSCREGGDSGSPTQSVKSADSLPNISPPDSLRASAPQQNVSSFSLVAL